MSYDQQYPYANSNQAQFNSTSQLQPSYSDYPPPRRAEPNSDYYDFDSNKVKQEEYVPFVPQKQSHTMRWIIGGLILLVLIGAGVGVGVWQAGLHKSSNLAAGSSSSGTSSSSTGTTTAGYTVSTASQLEEGLNLIFDFLFDRRLLPVQRK